MQAIRYFVKGLFWNVESSPAATDQMEEMIADLTTKASELVAAGMSEGEAVERVIAELGDTRELLWEFQHENNRFNPPPEAQRTTPPDLPNAPPSFVPPPDQPLGREQRKKELTLWIIVMLASGAIITLISLISDTIMLSVLSDSAYMTWRQLNCCVTVLNGWTLLFMFPFLCASAYSFCMFMVRLWQEIPRDIARITPYQAAGFSFIPIFHLYWYFVAYLGLVEDMNKTTARLDRSVKPLDTSLTTNVCIFWAVCGALSYLFAMVNGALPNMFTTMLTMLLSIGDLAVTIAFTLYLRHQMNRLIDRKTD